MKKLFLGLGAAAVLLPTLASAQGYIGASVGRTELEVSDADRATLSSAGVSVDDTDTGFKVFAGYRLHPNFALEAFYTDLGKVTASDGTDSIEVESDGFGGAVLGLIPVTDTFDLFAKVGFYTWDAELSSTVGVSSSDDDSDPMFGFGAAYHLNQLSFRAEFERYELDTEDVDMLSIGAALSF